MPSLFLFQFIDNLNISLSLSQYNHISIYSFHSSWKRRALNINRYLFSADFSLELNRACLRQCYFSKCHSISFIPHFSCASSYFSSILMFIKEIVLQWIQSLFFFAFFQMDISCPECKTTKRINPKMKLMVSKCGHSLYVHRRCSVRKEERVASPLFRARSDAKTVWRRSSARGSAFVPRVKLS